MSYLCSLATSVSNAPSTKTIYDFLEMLGPYVIAVGAAFLSSYLTMKNARMLQDRERRRDEKSLAALLSADLHRKLIMLVNFLQDPRLSNLGILEQIDTSTTVLDAALPKLGSLGHQGAANLLAVFDGFALLMDDVRSVSGYGPLGVHRRVKPVALHTGRVLKTLWRVYELDRPDRFEKIDIDLEAIDLKELKDLGF